MLELNFSNMTDFAHAGDTPCPEAWGNDSHGLSRGDWQGTKDYNEAINLATHGWPEGRKMMFAELEAMKALPSRGVLNTWARDVAGFLPDVPRAISGMPDCMFNAGEESFRSKPVVRVLVNLGRQSNIKAESINQHGAAILTWIDKLEGLGFSTEITAVMRAKDNVKTDHMIKVELKQAGEVLDMDRLAFALVNPAFQRRFKFGVIERQPSLSDLIGRYGSSMDVNQELREEYTVYTPILYINYRTRQDALNNVSNMFRHQLIEAKILTPDQTE